MPFADLISRTNRAMTRTTRTTGIWVAELAQDLAAVFLKLRASETDELGCRIAMRVFVRLVSGLLIGEGGNMAKGVRRARVQSLFLCATSRS